MPHASFILFDYYYVVSIIQVITFPLFHYEYVYVFKSILCNALVCIL